MHSEAEVMELGDKLPDLPAVDRGEGPIDWEARSAAFVAEARARDARLRYAALIKEAPQMEESDWEHKEIAMNREQIERVLAWRPVEGARGLLLSGESGRGKTRAVYGLLRVLALEHGLDFRYWHASDWFAQLQMQVRFGRDEARSWVEATAARPLVVMDDLGQEAMERAN